MSSLAPRWGRLEFQTAPESNLHNALVNPGCLSEPFHARTQQCARTHLHDPVFHNQEVHMLTAVSSGRGKEIEGLDGTQPVGKRGESCQTQNVTKNRALPPAWKLNTQILNKLILACVYPPPLERQKPVQLL